MSISDRLDRLPMTPTMRKVILITGIGWLFDSMDQGMVSGVIASIGRDWQLSTLELGYLSSAGILGMMVGALLAGFISDRFGRRTAIIGTLLLFSLGSALCGLAQSYETLLVFRFLTGLGLGGELPVASTLVSEFSPLRARGRNVVILESFWAWGWIAAALVAYLLIPTHGWRIAFFVGALPALFAAILRFAVPESPRFLESRGRYHDADGIVRRMEDEAGVDRGESVLAIRGDEDRPKAGAAPSIRDLWSRTHVRSTCVLWVLWFGINFGYYGFVLWTPSLLIGQGYDMIHSFQYTLIMCVAQLPGYAAAAVLVEKIGRKPTLVAFMTGTAVAAWFFGQATGTAAVLTFGCLLYFFALGAWGCVYSYTPELYPTSIRGLGTGWASAFGRVGALIAPMMVPVLYGFFGPSVGFTAVFILLAGVFLTVAVVILVFGVETRRRPLP